MDVRIKCMLTYKKFTQGVHSTSHSTSQSFGHTPPLKEVYICIVFVTEDSTSTITDWADIQPSLKFVGGKTI